jgi:hypothetical protein
MADFLLVVAFSLSGGALVLFLGLGISRYRSRGLTLARQAATPDCLGDISKRHDEYCSTICPIAARCMLLAMDDYMRKHPGLLFSPDSSEQY